MVFNNIKEYFEYLGKQDKLAKKKKRTIKNLGNKDLAKVLQKNYDKGYVARTKGN